MTHKDFWKQVEQRVEENQEIVQGGMPKSFAKVMEVVGLRFWVFGMWTSLTIAVWLWVMHRIELLALIRRLIWR